MLRSVWLGPGSWLGRSLPYLLILLLAGGAISPWGMALEERLGLEALFRLRGPLPPPPNVVVVALTRNSARQLGLPEKLYQWSRREHAALVQALQLAGARLQVFDIFFEQARDEEGDQAFSDAIKAAGNVLLFSRSERELISAGAGHNATASIETLRQPLAEFRARALGTAPLILPKVPARVSRFYWRHPAFENVPTLPGLAWLQQLPQNQQQARHWPSMRPNPLLNLYGPPRTITTLELAAIMQGQGNALQQVKGATVFIGYSAVDQPDQRDGFYTAFTSSEGLDISGVELAATAFANLVANNWLREWLPWQSGLLLFGIGVFSFLVSRYLAPLWSGVILLGSSLLMGLLMYLAFVTLYLWLPLFSSIVVMVPLCGGFGMWLRSRELDRQKNRLQWAFGKYLPAEELQRLVTERGLPGYRDYNNSVCLVTDAQGYSRLSETMSPAQLAELMQSYYQAIIPAIRKGGGIISDVAGDGVIALWLHLDAQSAWSALQPVVAQINDNIDRFNRTHPGQELPTRIGIHSGEIVLGHFGAMDHHEFRAMGDIINTTARLEGANKQLGTRVLISESCVMADDDSLRYLGQFQFVGKHNPLCIYTLKTEPDPVLLKQYQLAVIKFEEGGWQEALQLLRAVQRYYPEDGPTAFMLAYLEHQIALLKQDNGKAQENIATGVIVLSSK